MKKGVRIRFLTQECVKNLILTPFFTFPLGVSFHGFGMVVVLSTFPDAAQARRVGRMLVEERLVACVTLMPKAESFFMWEGAIQTATEVLTLFKTTRVAYPALEVRLNELHPYDVPEIIALPVESGLAAYVGWVEALGGG